MSKLLKFSFCLLGTIDNLTSLEVLDISGNSLMDKIFDEETIFGFQPNLTHLAMHDNRFTKLPISDLVKHKKLKMLDIRNNRIKDFSPEFTEAIKNQGLRIRYNGK